jgi:hypothetical protein
MTRQLKLNLFIYPSGPRPDSQYDTLPAAEVASAGAN